MNLRLRKSANAPVAVRNALAPSVARPSPKQNPIPIGRRHRRSAVLAPMPAVRRHRVRLSRRPSAGSALRHRRTAVLPTMPAVPRLVARRNQETGVRQAVQRVAVLRQKRTVVPRRARSRMLAMATRASVLSAVVHPLKQTAVPRRAASRMLAVAKHASVLSAVVLPLKRAAVRLLRVSPMQVPGSVQIVAVPLLKPAVGRLLHVNRRPARVRGAIGVVPT